MWWAFYCFLIEAFICDASAAPKARTAHLVGQIVLQFFFASYVLILILVALKSHGLRKQYSGPTLITPVVFFYTYFPLSGLAVKYMAMLLANFLRNNGLLQRL